MPGIITENSTTPGSVSQFFISPFNPTASKKALTGPKEGLKKMEATCGTIDKISEDHSQRKLDTGSGCHAFYRIKDYLHKISVIGE